MSANNHSAAANITTREKILQASHNLFSTQGYAATSIRQIASASRLVPAGIYNHFQSKEDIFQAVLLQNNPFTDNVINFNTARPGKEDVQNILEAADHQPGFFNLVLVDLLEFKGKHLPVLMDQNEAGPASARSTAFLLSLIISYYTYQSLLTGIFPAVTPPQISPADILDFFLDNSLALE
ncbi:MAG: helix-turn-helix domain-containing protein [Chloroflexota bacterium]